MAIASRLDSSGNFSIQNTGVFDEVTIAPIAPVIYGGLTLTYTFTSDVATATFGGLTIVGNPGSGYNAGGTYSVTGTATVQGTLTNGGANGGNGELGTTSALNGAGGTGGGIGTYNATSVIEGHNDVNGLFAAVTGAGTSSSNFGKGAYGGAEYTGSVAHNGTVGFFAGGGGGGGGGGNGTSFYGAGAAGGNAAIVFQYQIAGTNYYQLVNESSGAGSFTFPTGTNYVQIWAIGKGASGSSGSFGSSNAGGGNGGKAGGVAWATFDGTSLNLTNIASRQDNLGNHYIISSGMYDEVTIYPISGGIARRQDSSGNYYVAGILDETSTLT